MKRFLLIAAALLAGCDSYEKASSRYQAEISRADEIKQHIAALRADRSEAAGKASDLWVKYSQEAERGGAGAAEAAVQAEECLALVKKLQAGYDREIAEQLEFLRLQQVRVDAAGEAADRLRPKTTIASRPPL